MTAGTGPVARAGVATDVGLVREANEDSWFARGSVFVVADGMGGHAAGEVASAIAASTLGELAHRDDLTVPDLVAAVAEANRQIVQTAVRNPRQWGMATTLTGVVLAQADGARAWVAFNIGDSRVYRYAARALTQLTVDHSEVQELVDAGYLTAEQARVHPLRHTVTRSLGRDRAPVVDTWVLPVESDEWFLICSDGLTNEVGDEQIASVLAQAGPDVQAAADALVRQAVANGGRDNVTVVIVETVGWFAG